MSTPISSSPWLVCPRPQPQSQLRLICLPYAGGAASIYRTWPNGLPPQIEVWAVQLPGRETRFAEPLIDSLDLVLEGMLHAVEPLLTKPFAIFGHSFGSLLGFLLCRRLRAAGLPLPAHFFAAARRAPHLPPHEPPLADLPEPALLAALRRYNGTPEAVLQHAELRALMLPILRNDFALNDSYGYHTEAPLDCPLSAFGGLRDPTLTQADLDAWRMHTSRRFSLRMLPGDHFFLQQAQPTLLTTLAADLAEHINKI